MTPSRLRRLLNYVACCALLGGAAIVTSPGAVAQNCAPGFIPNPYTPECLAPVNTATINGIPCVPSNIGLCSSFVQNQQPTRVPRSSVG